MTESIKYSAVYAGTFDPITNGHLDIIQRALKIFDRVYVAVADSTLKNAMFSLEQREHFVKNAVKELPAELQSRITVERFYGLLVDYVRAKDAAAIVRGLRAVSDYEYEAQMALVNRHLADDIETVFLVTSAHCAFISSSIVRNIASSGGDIQRFVPSNVYQYFRDNF